VVYVYLDHLSDMISGWGRSKRVDDEQPRNADVTKQAAE
jgi:HAE1 family hydrophobic/amphiphilic exporter-1